MRIQVVFHIMYILSSVKQRNETANSTDIQDDINFTVTSEEGSWIGLK